MIKLIIFDLDGVLVDARELHYEALNRALCIIDEKFTIDRREHLSTYDGLPTKKKLDLLTKNKGLPKEFHNRVWKLKQGETRQLINKFGFDHRIREILRKLRWNHKFMLHCATNSIRDTAKLQLIKKGFFEYIDYLYSNEDVKNPKPNVEMYLRCMIKAGVGPKETLIIEDSHIGRKAALDSGAYLCPIINSDNVTYEKIMSFINKIEGNKKDTLPKWQGEQMNILIPMAGAGKRFQSVGYTFPKPLVEIDGKPMIQVVVENLNIDANYIFIVQKEHYERYNLKYLLNLISPNCTIIQTEGVTEGAACTTLLAENLINNDHPLLIANSDQYIEWNSNEFMYSMMADKIDGGILTFENTHSKWSYAKLDNNGYVCQVAEKKPISNIATIGIYHWTKGSDYVKYAKQMIHFNIRTNNEFYVCPVYNEAIADGKKIKTFHIEKMWGLGTPEDLNLFISKNT
jgi:HAD superfamily hydrolase (TIGR01509 family)